jgi:4-hydroxysphinganine ceramide fatty acyl 2-hydroxylase
MKHLNKDITKAFDNIESHHTKTAIRDLETFCIGEIKVDKDNKIVLNETESKYDIDLKKGILWQVFTKLNLKDYIDFIHDPKHMINPPEAILFETPILEIFTKTPFWVILILWIPVIFYNLYLSLGFGFTIPTLILCYLFGIFIWTFIEYMLHRFFFHIDDGLPDNRYVIMLHFLFHGIHHAFPMDK